MKKAYVKPGLFMESFEMAEHIAKCGINSSSDNEFGFVANFYADECNATINYPGLGEMNIFADSAKCVITDIGGFEQLCYQGTEGDNVTIFGS